MNSEHQRISDLKHRWNEEDAARDELELQERRKFLEQEASEVFTSIGAYFTRLAKALRTTGVSVESDERWEHLGDQALRRMTRVISSGQQLRLDVTVQGTSILYRDKPYRIPGGIEALIPVITSDVEQFLEGPPEGGSGGSLKAHDHSAPGR